MEARLREALEKTRNRQMTIEEEMKVMISKGKSWKEMAEEAYVNEIYAVLLREKLGQLEDASIPDNDERKKLCTECTTNKTTFVLTEENAFGRSYTVPVCHECNLVKIMSRVNGKFVTGIMMKLLDEAMTT